MYFSLYICFRQKANSLHDVVKNSDGAAALILVSGEKAKELRLQVIARIKGFADAAQVFNISVAGHFI